MNIIIKNIDIITMDKKEILKNSNIYIKDEKIFYVGEFLKDFEAEKIIDGKGKVAMPGLINTHTHTPMSIFRNYADDMNLEDWLFKKIFPLEAKLKDEDVYNATLLSLIEMVKSGTTTFCDMYFMIENSINAVKELPLRAFFARGISNGENEDDSIKEVVDYNKKYKDNDMINFMLGPHSVYTCDKNLLLKCKKTAIENNLLIHIHLNESKTEVSNCIKENNKSPIAYCDSLGIFDIKTMAAHCANTDDNDLKILKEKNVSVLNNPTSNLKLASGFARVKDMLDMGINVSLGTDGAASNNNLNMFKEINLAALLNKALTEDPKAVNAYETLQMATINGAKALNMENVLGKIKKDFLADIIIIDMQKPHLYPINNVYSALCYSSIGFDVDTSIINGKIIMEEGKILGVDIKKAMKKAQESIERLKE